MALFRGCQRIVDSPFAGTLALLLLSLSGMVTTALVVGLPVPRVHDEFAYLLAAETFAEGRLTNPTHPFWRHFETFHVIHEPSYQAKYPPAQALFLAVGVLLGHPILGVWAGVLLLVGSTAWALRGLLEPRWALFTTLLLVLAVGIAGDWAQSYWGGAVAAAGGALVFGATLRIVNGDARWPDGALGGLGLALLANSRPLEGLLLATAAGVWILLIGSRHTARVKRALPAIGLALFIGCVGVAATGIYNHFVTGAAATFPYMVHTERYAHSPSFFMLPEAEGGQPDIHPDIEELNRVWDEERRQAREDGMSGVLDRAPRLLRIVGGPGVVLLLMLPLVWKDRGVKGSLALFLVVLLPVLLTTAARPHYLAAATAPLYALIGLAARRLGSGGTRRLGVPLLVVIVTIALADVVGYARYDLARNEDWAHQRQALLEDLQAAPGLDLVFVHYPDEHFTHWDWVFNRPRIDDAEVVWARPLHPRADSALVEYFADRRIWDLQVDRVSRPVRLTERPR